MISGIEELILITESDGAPALRDCCRPVSCSMRGPSGMDEAVAFSVSPGS